MAIWNGLTEEGAVVPIQVDAQGRVVVSGSGGAPSEVYGTAKALARISGNGDLKEGRNFSTVQVSVGTYEFSFINPLTTTNYVVVATPITTGDRFVRIFAISSSSFQIKVVNASNSSTDTELSVAVFDFSPSQVTPLILPNSALQDIQRLKDAIGLADS